MTVRPARRGELKEIRRLIALFPEQLIQDPIPRLKTFYVALVRGQIVGCCALEIYSRRIAEIRSLAVEREHQGHGIASKLIGACLRRAKARNIYEVFTITGSDGLFSKFGFGTIARQKYALFRVLRP